MKKNKYIDAFNRLHENYKSAFDLTRQEEMDWHLLYIACMQVVSPNKRGRIKAEAKQDLINSLLVFLKGIK